VDERGARIRRGGSEGRDKEQPPEGEHGKKAGHEAGGFAVAPQIHSASADPPEGSERHRVEKEDAQSGTGGEISDDGESSTRHRDRSEQGNAGVEVSPHGDWFAREEDKQRREREKEYACEPEEATRCDRARHDGRNQRK